MAARFFCSIPHAVAVRDPYEEVFELFTTETSDAPWAHNRSVAQNATRLELELDYTPAPSPVASRPSSRPDSRASLSGGAAFLESPLPGVTSLDDPSSSNVNSSHGRLPRVRTPAGKPSLGSRKSSRKEQLGKPTTPKKPVVIHQSLSTLSQPGQTGTVVWDSSILMSKFLLSIQGLSMACYLQQEQQDQEGHNGSAIDQQQIRRLEEQAEHLSVSEDGSLERKSEESIPEPQAPPASSSLDPPTKRKLELHISRKDQERHRLKQAQKHAEEDSDGMDDGADDEDAELDSEAQLEADQRLVFDPAETSILELGSGCGLLGIVMAELCQDLLLTDQKPVLPLLVKNLRKNLDKKYFDQDSTSDEAALTTPASLKKKNRDGQTAPSSLAGGSTIKPCHIQVQELVWGQDLDQDLKRGLGVDFVVATDVVYNESIVPKLVDTLLELCMVREQVRHDLAVGHGDNYERLSALADALAQNDSSRKRRPLKRTVVLLAQELRTDYVHLAFLEGLEAAGFRMVRMPKEMMDPDFQSGYAIYACFLKKSIGRNM
ncbi:hypothetical protein EMPS_05263 [Entomortierella parvispora]|uniref:Uncharacterized protein n=1 Tax=Entomortierella parvispora TaxID=205924 RepID=A0A9P3HAE2_9FUNG|nr:hypothetical protein EMPS_05263 [Entomortierella parvispora]